MICPKCKAEYREGFTVCADCDIPLVAPPPNPPSARSSDYKAAPDESNFFDTQNTEDPFCTFWEGEDPRVCADICSVLDDATIPHRVLRQEPHIFRIRADSHIKIGVPFSLFEKAENAISEAFGGAEEAHRLLRPDEPNPEQLATLVRQALKKRGQEEKRRSPLLFADATTGEPQQDGESATAEELSIEPADTARSAASQDGTDELLTQEVWRGTAIHTGEFIANCLKENGIHFCSATGSEDMRIFVSEANEAHACEIVGEVVDATPPE